MLSKSKLRLPTHALFALYVLYQVRVRVGLGLGLGLGLGIELG